MDPIGRIQVVDQSSDSHDFEHSFEVFVVVFAALKLCWKRKLWRPVHDAKFGLLYTSLLYYDGRKRSRSNLNL